MLVEGDLESGVHAAGFKKTTGIVRKPPERNPCSRTGEHAEGSSVVGVRVCFRRPCDSSIYYYYYTGRGNLNSIRAELGCGPQNYSYYRYYNKYN